MAGMGGLRPTPGGICPSQAHLHKLRGAKGCTNTVQPKDYKATNIRTPLRIVPAQPQPHCPGVKLITWSQSGAVWKIPFQIKRLSRRHIGHKGIAIPGHSTYRMLKGGTKGWKRPEV